MFLKFAYIRNCLDVIYSIGIESYNIFAQPSAFHAMAKMRRKTKTKMNYMNKRKMEADRGQRVGWKSLMFHSFFFSLLHGMQKVTILHKLMATGVQMKMIFNVNRSRDLKVYSIFIVCHALKYAYCAYRYKNIQRKYQKKKTHLLTIISRNNIDLLNIIRGQAL